jgi:hypothetical protein
MKKWPVKKWPVVSDQWPVTNALPLYAVAIVRNLKLAPGPWPLAPVFGLVTGHWPLATVLL